MFVLLRGKISKKSQGNLSFGCENQQLRNILMDDMNFNIWTL